MKVNDFSEYFRQYFGKLSKKGKWMTGPICLKAPRKKIIWFEQSGHMLHYEENAKYVEELNNVLNEQTKQPVGTNSDAFMNNKEIV